MPAAIRQDTRRATTRPRFDPRTLARRADRALAALGRSEAELSILLADDATLRELNLRHRGVDDSTDVLSFPMDDTYLGDVAISLETAHRQATNPALVASRLKRLSLPPTLPWGLREELTFLMIHGLLHVVGHDHGEPEDEATMIKEERRLVLAVVSP